jgi:hypothetical protein
VRIAFGRYVLDLEQRRLLADDLPVRLGPKAFELLRLLVEHRPRALSKDEILAAVWPGTFVTDNSLATHIADLRAALDDDAQRPRFIRTVYGYGYAFVAEAGPAIAPVVVPLPADWRLLLVDRDIVLTNGEHTLGRGAEGDLVIASPTVSRRHARLSVDGERATLEDLGSKNGTWVNDKPVTGVVCLADGDMIKLGSILLNLRRDRRHAATETAILEPSAIRNPA